MSKIKEEILHAFPDEEFLFADGYEDAIIGVNTKNVVCYDREKCIEILMKDMSREDAEEYFSYNTEGAYVGEKTPIYVHFFKP